MNPLCKAALIFAGLLWALIFALMIPASTLQFGKEIVRYGFRNGKRSGYWGRMNAFVAYDAVRDASTPHGASFNFPGVPCFDTRMEYHKDGYAEPTYEDLKRDPLGEYNWRSNSEIDKVWMNDCVLTDTPYAGSAFCVRPMICYPADANATTCNCYWNTVDPVKIGYGIPVRNNANRKIIIVLDYYTHDTQFHTRRVAIDSTGLQLDLGSLFQPGKAWLPSWDLPLPTTSYSKRWCIEWRNLKECFTTLIADDIEPAARIVKPVGSVLFAMMLLCLDLVVFMVLFAVTGGSAKVGPAK